MISCVRTPVITALNIARKKTYFSGVPVWGYSIEVATTAHFNKYIIIYMIKDNIKMKYIVRCILIVFVSISFEEGEGVSPVYSSHIGGVRSNQHMRMRTTTPPISFFWRMF